MQLSLFEPARLAKRPYCTDGLDSGVVVRGVGTALKKRYIQANCPALMFRIVVDVDHDVRNTARMHQWLSDYKAPQPNWTAMTPATGRSHLGYEIEVPVARHEHARNHPIRLAEPSRTV